MSTYLSRAQRDLLSEFALAVEGERRGKHLVVTVRNQHGVVRTVVFSVTGSDVRAVRNLRSDLRRIANETKPREGSNNAES